MDHPVRTVNDGHILNKDILAAERFDEIRRHDGTGSEIPVTHRHKVDSHLAESILLGGALRTHPCKSGLRVSVDDSLAGDGYIVAVPRPDERRIVIQLRTFPDSELGR